MDTRSKIISLAGAAALPAKAVVSGHFDPMTAAHLARLREIAPEGGLTILVTPVADPLMPTRARAELMAGLAVAGAVVELDGPAPDLFAGRPVIHEEERDLDRRKALMQHVLERQER